MNGVVAVDPRELPRVSARDAVALTRAARAVAGLPARVEATLGELGLVVITCEGVDALAPASGREPGGDVVLGLPRASGAGRLVIDGAFARRVIALALGGDVRPGTPLAWPSFGERGVVAGVVASVLHACGAPFSVALVAPDAASVANEGAVAIALTVALDEAVGWARLEIPSRWLASSRAPNPEVGALEVEARVEIARTRLLAGELAGLGPGDAVVFDGEPSFHDGAAGVAGAGVERPVRVVVGGHAARARLRDDGRVTLGEALGPQSPVGTSQEVTMDTRDDVDAVGHEREGGEVAKTRTVDVAAVLAAAPIEVVAELGRLVLRGDEIAGLGPGAVLTLGRAGASPVALRVGGEIWAEGELVDVEGELGVRVTVSRRSGLPDGPR